jgi:hypothetical protein
MGGTLIGAMRFLPLSGFHLRGIGSRRLLRRIFDGEPDPLHLKML